MDPRADEFLNKFALPAYSKSSIFQQWTKLMAENGTVFTTLASQLENRSASWSTIAMRRSCANFQKAPREKEKH